MPVATMTASAVTWMATVRAGADTAKEVRSCPPGERTVVFGADTILKTEWRRSNRAPDHRSVLVTVIVTKTPWNEPYVVRQGETVRCRRLRPAWRCATGWDGLGRRSACS